MGADPALHSPGSLGKDDPLFGKDIGFYLFSLPAYVALKNWMVLILALSAAMAGAVYLLHGQIYMDSRFWRFSPAAIAHGSALLGLYFAVKAWSYALDRYLLLYNDNGVVLGAGYTDVHIELPVLWLLIGLACAAALVAWVNVRLRKYWLVLGAVAWCSAVRSSSVSWSPALSSASTSSQANCNWSRRICNATSPKRGTRTT